MPSKPKTNQTRNTKRKTGNRSRRTGCRLCGERESVRVHEKDIRFVEPAGPAPPFEPPRPIFRRRARPLDPRASRGASRVQSPVSRLQPRQETQGRERNLVSSVRSSVSSVSRPKTRDSRPETGNRTRETAMSREDFLRTGTGLGGALFAAAVAFGKKKKKK